MVHVHLLGHALHAGHHGLRTRRLLDVASETALAAAEDNHEGPEPGDEGTVLVQSSVVGDKHAVTLPVAVVLTWCLRKSAELANSVETEATDSHDAGEQERLDAARAAHGRHPGFKVVSSADEQSGVDRVEDHGGHGEGKND